MSGVFVMGPGPSCACVKLAMYDCGHQGIFPVPHMDQQAICQQYPKTSIYMEEF